ncbi:MAG: hypothetical protein INR70_29040 [Parafilimonas terrae]|nr:hypothetical protein [Parafilimonas terrae]
MTPEQKAYLQALADVRSWHRWQIGQSVGDARTIQAHEMAIAWIDEVIAAKKRHAAEDEAENTNSAPGRSQERPGR